MNILRRIRIPTVRVVIVLSVALCLISGAIFLPASDETIAHLAVTDLELPDEVEAGMIVSIAITSEQHSGQAEVQVSNAFGRLAFAVEMTSGSGRLDLPAAVTQQAGELTVTSGDVRETLTVIPGDVVEVVAPLVGPRTIVADRMDTSLAVVFPIDQYGNQVADGTEVSVEWQRTAEIGEPASATTIDVETANGMAHALIQSGEVAGPTMVRTIAETRTGQEINGVAVRIDEVPGTVTEIDLDASSEHGRADGRSLIELETSELVDFFGNELADGTLAQFVFDGPAGQGVIPGTVQNGVVRIELVAPDHPGLLVGHLELHGTRSNDVRIEFESAIASVDAVLDTVGTDIIVRVTAALDPNGAFIADGTDVQWGQYRTQLRHGSAAIQIPASLLPDDLPMVQILGLDVEPMGAQ